MDLTGDNFKQLASGLKRNCNALKIPFLDLSPFVAEEEKNGNHLYWNYDVHMKAQGYLWTGKVLFNWWNRMEENN